MRVEDSSSTLGARRFAGAGGAPPEQVAQLAKTLHGANVAARPTQPAVAPWALDGRRTDLSAIKTPPVAIERFSPDQILLLERAILQFESDGEVAARALKVLHNPQTLDRDRKSKVSLGWFTDNRIEIDPETRTLAYFSHDDSRQFSVCAQEGGCEVTVRVPECAEAIVRCYPEGALDGLELNRVRRAAEKLCANPSYQAWRAIPGDDGKLPKVPVLSSILAAAAYDRLFADGLLDITIAYGYLEDEPCEDPLDMQQACALREELVTKHGFIPSSPDDEWVLEKPFGYDGRELRCRVTIVYSAVPASEGEQAQMAQSMKARDVFMGGLKCADVVMYDGHSRIGRGPDFTPPKELTSAGNIKIGPMVPFYLELGSTMIRFPIPFSGGGDFEQEVFDRDRYQILVMDSCRSDAYYRNRISDDAERYSGKTAATLDLITTDNDSSTEDSIPTKLKVILDLMAGMTAPEIDRHLNTRAETRYNTTGLFVDRDVETRVDEYIPPRRPPKKKNWVGQKWDQLWN